MSVIYAIEVEDHVLDESVVELAISDVISDNTTLSVVNVWRWRYGGDRVEPDCWAAIGDGSILSVFKAEVDALRCALQYASSYCSQASVQPMKWGDTPTRL